MSIKFLVLGGGRVFWVWGGGGVPILFLWARGFKEEALLTVCSAPLPDLLHGKKPTRTLQRGGLVPRSCLLLLRLSDLFWQGIPCFAVWRPPPAPEGDLPFLLGGEGWRG